MVREKGVSCFQCIPFLGSLFFLKRGHRMRGWGGSLSFLSQFSPNITILWLSTYFSNKSKRESFNLLSPPADDLEKFLVSLFTMGFLMLTSVNFKYHSR